MRNPLTRRGSAWVALGVLAAISLAGNAHALNTAPCADSAPACMGECPGGQTCVGITRGGTVNCVCRDTGCCRIDANSCSDGVTALSCLAAGGSWGRGETCAGGCPTTGEPNGSDCSDAAECQSDSCVDGVCCDAACDGPNQACNLPGQVGECATVPATAPAASGWGLALIALTLAAVAAVGLLRRRARGPAG